MGMLQLVTAVMHIAHVEAVIYNIDKNGKSNLSQFQFKKSHRIMILYIPFPTVF